MDAVERQVVVKGDDRTALGQPGHQFDVVGAIHGVVVAAKLQRQVAAEHGSRRDHVDHPARDKVLLVVLVIAGTGHGAAQALAPAVDQDGAATPQDDLRMGLCGVQAQVQAMWQGDVVAVQHRDPGVPGVAQAAVAVLRRSQVPAADQPDSAVAAGVAAGYGDRPVCRGIVGTDQLPAGIGLGQHALDRLPQEGFRVVGPHDNTNQERHLKTGCFASAAELPALARPRDVPAAVDLDLRLAFRQALPLRLGHPADLHLAALAQGRQGVLVRQEPHFQAERRA